MTLPASGLVVDTKEQVLDSVIQRQQQDVSPNIEVDDDTGLGQVNQIICTHISLTNQLVQDVYDARNILVAEGKALDDTTAWMGVYRQRATATNGEQYFTGVDGTVVPPGAYVKNTFNGNTYRTDTAVSMSKAACRASTFSINTVLDTTAYNMAVNGLAVAYTSDASATATEIIAGLVGALTQITIDVDTVSNATLYTVTIDSVNYEYTSDGTATADEITSNLQSTIQAAVGTPGVTAVDNVDGSLTLSTAVAVDILSKTITVTASILSIRNDLTGKVFTAVDNGDDTLSITSTNFADMVITNDTTITIDEVTSAGNITGTKTGIFAAPANTVSIIASPAGGWTSTTNPVSLTIGREVESDLDFRNRAIAFRAANGTATIDSMLAALSAIDGVSAVSINQQFVSEGDDGVTGQPAGSLQIVISGGSDDDVIAQTIWDTKPGGQEIWAQATVETGNAIDFNGNTQVVNFNRPTAVPINNISITYEVYDTDIYPDSETDANDAIKAVIALQGNQLDAGESVVIAEFEGTIYGAVGGIFNVTFISGDQAITSTEQAVFDVSTMTVVKV